MAYGSASSNDTVTQEEEVELLCDRNISTELQESSYIFIAMALILFVPVLVIARDNVAAFYFVTAGLVFVVCSFILLLIFIPKVKALRILNKTVSIGWPASHRSSSAEEGLELINTGNARAFDFKPRQQSFKTMAYDSAPSLIS